MALSIAFFYFQNTSSIKNNGYDKLLSIRDLKVEQINSWLAQREIDTRTLAESSRFSQLGPLFRDELEINETRSAYNEIKNVLKNFLELNPVYADVFIINPVSGKVAVSTNFDLFGNNLIHDDLYTKPLQTGAYYIKDVYQKEGSNLPMMAFAMPIFEHEYLLQGKQISGILVATTYLNNSIFRYLDEKRGLGGNW